MPAILWKKTKFSAVVLALALVGCSTTRPGARRAEPPESIPPKSLVDVLNTTAESPTPAPQISTGSPDGAGDWVVRGIHLKNTDFDIPITINSRVEYWVDYFTGRGRKHFARYLERSEFFIPYIAPLLKQNGMPEDLVYLAMIESGFNNFARSHAKAVGPWQFISATGKRYGLAVNWWVDERRDIRKSTLAAVGYLRDLYGMYRTWELAAASYNAGEAKLARAIQRFGTKDFWVISKQKFLRQETRDYVPKIIAAAIIAKNRQQFGFAAAVAKPGADEAVAGDGEVVKVVKTDKPLEDNQNIHNPNVRAEALRDDDDDVAPSVTPATLTVPYDNASDDGVQANNDRAPDNGKLPLAKPVPTPHVSKDGQVGGAEIAEFEVQSPADMLKIARAAGVSYMTVKALNPELLRWCTPPGAGTYRVKLPASTKEKFLATYNHEAFPRKVQFLTYKVRNGETLSKIAGHFGIKVDPITDLNGVSPRMRLRSGVKVLLPLPSDRSRSLASLDVRDPPEGRRKAVSRRHRRAKYQKITFKKRESARARARRELANEG